MADASTQSSTYQSIRIVNCYFRGSDLAFRNLEFAVTDGDSWWDYKQLKDILVSNSTFRQSLAAGIQIHSSSGGYIEPYGVVVSGCFFEENNSSATIEVGSAINANVESGVFSNNIVNAPAGASYYGIFVAATDLGNDSPNPSVVVKGNDCSKGTYSVEAVRVSVASTSVGSNYVQGDNIYAGSGRHITQLYKKTTTDATPTTIWSFVVPENNAGGVELVINGANADCSKFVSYAFRVGFSRATAGSAALSTGTTSFTLIREWPAAGTIAYEPLATLATNTLTATVTGVAAETWSWTCLVDLSTCK